MTSSLSSSPTGTLYVVATPIGNLEDLSDRVRRVLAEVDIVAAEDTRRTGTLLAHLGLQTRMESYHQHTEHGKAPALLRALQEGKSVALVSDAGVPVVSDPGAHLVALAWEQGVPVSPVPGPSAVMSALSVAGFCADRFLLAGYPPRKRGERLEFYRGLARVDVPVVLHEAPHRLRESLADAVEALGPDHPVLVAREMTKRFEELRRETLEEAREYYEARDPLGEFTLVLAPAPEQEEPAPADEGPRRAATLLVEAGLHTRQAAEILSAATGLGRNDAYALLIRTREE